MTIQTMISWELGTRALTIPRHVEVCQAIGVDPAVVLTKALVTVGDIDRSIDGWTTVNPPGVRAGDAEE